MKPCVGTSTNVRRKEVMGLARPRYVGRYRRRLRASLPDARQLNTLNTAENPM